MTIISLHYATQPIIEDPVAQVIYIIRSFVYHPGFVSTMFSEQEISFRGLITRYPDNPQAVADAAAQQLQGAISRLLPDYGLRVAIDFAFQDANNYKLSLDVLDPAGNAFIPTGLIKAIDDQFSFEYVGVK